MLRDACRNGHASEFPAGQTLAGTTQHVMEHKAVSKEKVRISRRLKPVEAELFSLVPERLWSKAS